MSEEFIYKRDRRYRDYTEDVQAELPPYLDGFFRYQKGSTQLSTQLEQARDVQNFLRFIKATDPDCTELPLKKIPLEKVTGITADDIDRYIDWLITDSEEKKKVKPPTVNRRLSSLSNMYKYFMRRGEVAVDPVLLVHRPKQHKKIMCYLSTQEAAKWIDDIWTLRKMMIKNPETKELIAVPSTAQYRANHLKYVLRDVAMIMTFLGTGIRVSELVQLDRMNIDLEKRTLRYIHKNGGEGLSEFSPEVQEILEMYLGMVPSRLIEKYGAVLYQYLDFCRDYCKNRKSTNKSPNAEDIDFLTRCKDQFGTDDQDFLADMSTLLKFHTCPGRLGLLKDRSTDAVFLSSRGTRITAVGVEQIIRNYAQMYPPSARAKELLTPHGLRKSFAMKLMAETGRVDMVQHALNHVSPRTSLEYYARAQASDVQKATANLEWLTAQKRDKN